MNIKSGSLIEILNATTGGAYGNRTRDLRRDRATC